MGKVRILLYDPGTISQLLKTQEVLTPLTKIKTADDFKDLSITPLKTNKKLEGNISKCFSELRMVGWRRIFLKKKKNKKKITKIDNSILHGTTK